MQEEIPTMLQFRLSDSTRIFVQNLLFISVGLLLSPVGYGVSMALQTFPLPQALSPLFRFALGLNLVVPLLWVVVTFGAPLLTLLALCARSFRRCRPYVPALIGVWLVTVGSFPVLRGTNRLRTAGLVKVAERSQPLIQALKKYREQHGHYPAELADLVPEHLPEIPYTGAVGYPQFRYRVATENSPFRAYQLQIFTPTGGINFDTFNYWPERKYPKYMYGGTVERIGDWAYVHE